MKLPDFIGIGGQRCATSWIYAGLYEHPELCLPFKEIHFFSKPRYKKKGLSWYGDRWKTCSKNALRGEYSTSYLSSDVAAERIKNDIPNAKLIVCLRNPVERAHSSYYNDIRAGVLSKGTTFEEALLRDPKYVEMGMYAKHLQRYLSLFPRDQILVLIYEDIAPDPKTFIQSIYRFLGVGDAFVPSMASQKINTSRTPRRVWVDRLMLVAARLLRSVRLHRLVWFVKKSGVPTKVRLMNTEGRKESMNEETRKKLQNLFRDDVQKLSTMLNRDFEKEWNINPKSYLNSKF